MNPPLRALVLVSFGAWAVAGPLAAQGPNTFTVSGLSNLNFGAVVTGSMVAVSPTAPSAALFSITGPKRTQVALAFSLPAALSGPSPLPVQFGGGSAAWSDTNSPAGAPAFNPANGLTVAMPNSRTVYVWLGGSLSVGRSQPTGTYAATVTISVALN